MCLDDLEFSGSGCVPILTCAPGPVLQIYTADIRLVHLPSVQKPTHVLGGGGQEKAQCSCLSGANATPPDCCPCQNLCEVKRGSKNPMFTVVATARMTVVPQVVLRDI